MKAISIIFLAFCALFTIVLAAEKPEIVYVQFDTPQEAEDVQKKILAEFTSFGSPVVTKSEEPEIPATVKEEKSKV